MLAEISGAAPTWTQVALAALNVLQVIALTWIGVRMHLDSKKP